MNGIMSGIEDRTNYSIGSPGQKNEIGLGQPVSARERLEGVADKFSSSGMDPFNQFLIQGGLNLMSQPSTGGLLSDIATAAKDPATNLFAGLSERDKLKRDIALSGEQLDIESDINKEKVAADQKFLSDMDDRDKKFKMDLFGEETDRLTNLQKNDFSNEAKILGLKQDFSGTEAEKERDLKLNMQKIDNALRSDLLNEGQRNKLEILQKQYENSLGILKAELDGSTGVDSIIKKGAEKLVEDDIVGSYAEAENQMTWKYKTSGDLMKQGYNVSDEFLNETDDLTKKAKKLFKKPGNEGRIYFSPKLNQYYVLEKGEGRGTFVPFNLPGAEEINKEKIDEADNVVEEVDGITNYEYGTSDARDQKRDTRQLITQMKGPINNPNPTYDTSMTRDQKSNYERYLSDYRNR